MQDTRRANQILKLNLLIQLKSQNLFKTMGVRVDGELLLNTIKGREHISPPFAEQELTNLFVRLSRTNNKPIMYLDGHGEKNLIGLKNYDLGEFGKQLENKGFKFSNPDSDSYDKVPSEGAMLGNCKSLK